MMKTIGNKDVYVVVSSVGGTVKEFVYHGENLIFQDRIVGNKPRGGIPICFPFFGKSIERFSSISQHGWLRHQELELHECTQNHIVFTGKNEITEEFPWKLKYEVIVSIDPANGSLTLKLITERLNDGEYYRAPINPGFHPYFYADSSRTSRHSIAKCMARVGSRVLTDFKMESEKIVVDSPILIKSGKQILSMQLCCDFNSDSQLTLWSDNADDYFCVEPVLTCQNVFAELEGGKFLNEGEKSEMAMNLTVV